MTSLPTLGYWNIRGLAQPIRLLLKYSGIQFNDKRYEYADGSDLQTVRRHWFEIRNNLGLDFPNLPYYMDHNIKLTQSITILRYLGRKYGLVANDEYSLAQQDLVEQQINDLKITFIRLILNNEFEELKQNFIDETLSQQLHLLNQYLGQNEWFIKKLTYVDFLGYETIDWFRLFSPQTVEKFPILRQYLNRFENLPQIKLYMSSPEFQSWPLFAPVVKWGHYR